MELRNEIARRVGCSLPGTLVFDYPTVAAISAFVASKLAPAQPASSGHGAVTKAAAGLGTAALVPVASSQALLMVTDVRGRLAEPPGAQALFGSLAAGLSDAMQPLPLDRWDPDFGRAAGSLGGQAPRAAGLLGARFGGFVLRWAGFDAAAFAIPPSGALLAGVCLPACFTPLQTCLFCACSTEQLQGCTLNHRTTHNECSLLPAPCLACRGCPSGPPAAGASGGGGRPADP